MSPCVGLSSLRPLLRRTARSYLGAHRGSKKSARSANNSVGIDALTHLPALPRSGPPGRGPSRRSRWIALDVTRCGARLSPRRRRQCI
eukprot:118250-Pyramimonas_sp.AAC.1